jgi:hypothetical protein
MSEPTPENFARAADMLGGMSVRHPIPYMGNVPLTIGRGVIEVVAEALDAAELRGHTRAVEETAIASIHKAVEAERAACVRRLREWASVGRVATANDYADEIERGDHREETKP